MGDMIIAIIVGVVIGAAAHFVSRGFGLEITLPGSLVACAIATAGMTRVRFVWGKEC